MNRSPDATLGGGPSGRAETENIPALYRLAALGAVVAILTLATPFAFRAGGDNAYMALAGLAGLVAVAATWTAERAPAARALWLIVCVAILLRLVLLLLDPMLSSDVYRYVWDGRVQAAGINPYRYFPADEALAPLRDAAIFPKINRAEYAVTIYPPVAQMFFLAVTRLGESVTVMRLALLAGEAVTVVVIVLLLRRMGRPVARVAAYAWHPLPMWEIANNGHIDALMVALMMLGLLLAFTGRPLRGAVSIVLGALVKPFALLALPGIWRPWDWKMPSVVLVVALLAYAPYLSVGTGVFGFLTAGYFSEEQLASGDRIWPLAAWRAMFGNLRGDIALYFAAVALVVVAMSLAAAFRKPPSMQASLGDINRLLLAFLLLVSPNYPWYFLAVTPFVALVGGAPVWVASIGALLLQEEAGWDPYVPLLIRKSILYGAFVLACLYSLRRTRRVRAAAGEHQS